MKNEDKKVPDAPNILFVCPFHTGLTSGWIDEEGNHQGGNPVWHGMAVRMSADDEEYINLSHAWHKQSEMPDSMDATIVVADKDYMYPEIIDLDNVTDSYIYSDMDDNEIWESIIDEHDFVYWALYSINNIIRKEAQNEKE